MYAASVVLLALSAALAAEYIKPPPPPPTEIAPPLTSNTDDAVFRFEVRAVAPSGPSSMIEIREGVEVVCGLRCDGTLYGPRCGMPIGEWMKFQADPLKHVCEVTQTDEGGGK
jgi:hypothetical protein